MEPEKKSNGALVGLVIIIIILILGGVYMWKSNEKVMESNQTQAENIGAQDSTELDSLEADVSGTDTSTGVDITTVN